MTREEIRLQVAISVIQGVLEAKHGIIGEVVPSVAVAIALRIADAFVEEWYREAEEQKPIIELGEDERIRKEIISFIKSNSAITNKKWIAYLEKQKENPKTVDSISADCVSDVKWVDTIITRVIVSLSDDVDYNRDEPCKYRQEIDDLKKLRDILCRQKEQKPTKWDFRPYGVNETVDKLIAIAECLEMDGDCLFNGNTGTECGKFLRELARKQIECKSEVWSEEDEKMRKLIVADIKSLAHGDKSSMWVSHADWLEERLKSLHPQPSWKPSEQEKGALRTAIHILTEERNFPKAAAQLQNILNAFEDKESRKDWKPSEEQMEILRDALAFLKYNYYKNAKELESFYSELKKNYRL